MATAARVLTFLLAKEDRKAHEFNCYQRGALNPHESYAATLFGLAFGGLSYPLVAAGAGECRHFAPVRNADLCAGAAFGVGSLLYFAGYASGDPSSRYNRGGLLMRLGSTVLLVLPLVTAYGLIRK